MILGVCFPALCLGLYEIYASLRGRISKEYLRYTQTRQAVNTEQLEEQSENDSREENDFSTRVIGTGIILSGTIIAVLSAINPSGRGLVCSVGIAMMLLGWYIRHSKQK